MTPEYSGSSSITVRSACLALVVLQTTIILGCSNIDYSLKKAIQSEANQLTLDVKNSDAVRRNAVSVINDDFKSEPDVELAKNSALEEYVVLALKRSPTVRRIVRQLQALGFRVEQVTSLEDPMFNLMPPTANMTETAAGMIDANFGISQNIPFPGKLSQRGRVAEQEVRMAFADLSDSRLQITADVSRAYFDYSLAHVSIEITNESQKLLEQIRAVASARYQAGGPTQQDLLRAEVEIYSLQSDLLTFQQQEISAKAKLNALMNRSIDAEIPPPSALKLEKMDLKLPELLDKALKSNPKLIKLKEQIKRDLESIRLARLKYYPDFSIGFSYTIVGSGISPVASGDDNWSVPLGINLPIWWQRIRAGINESNAKTLTSVEQFEEMRNIVFFGLQDTLIKIDTQFRQAALLQTLIIPRSQQAIEASTANYKAGNLEFTALVDNWRSWLKFSLAFQRNMAGLEQLFADLQQLIGASSAPSEAESIFETRLESTNSKHTSAKLSGDEK